MEMFLLPYNANSESAKNLANELGITRIKKEKSRWRHKDGRFVINWGCRALPPHCEGTNMINLPEAVDRASNKITCLEELTNAGIDTPRFTTDKAVAIDWINNGTKEVVCRQVLRGHSGEGIVIASSVEELVDAPLYTEYVPKKSEFRIHVVDSHIVRVARKARRLEIPDDQINWKVRNLDGGFIYATEEVHIGARPKIMARDAIIALGLDFGAVDIIYNQKHDRYYVLEINTAPGLTGGTVESYAHHLKHMVEIKNLKMEHTVEPGLKVLNKRGIGDMVWKKFEAPAQPVARGRKREGLDVLVAHAQQVLREQAVVPELFDPFDEEDED